MSGLFEASQKPRRVNCLSSRKRAKVELKMFTAMMIRSGVGIGAKTKKRGEKIAKRRDRKTRRMKMQLTHSRRCDRLQPAETLQIDWGGEGGG